MSSSSTAETATDPGPLPRRLFARDCYPATVRVNAYSKPQYPLDVLFVLRGLPEMQRLLKSPLGQLFSLPINETSFSGLLVHQFLCRQLCTRREDELWFVFGGYPMRFSLIEFESVTELLCSELPTASAVDSVCSVGNGAAPYWYKLIGGSPGSVTVESLVERLLTEKDMPSWRKFRLCLIVIVEGVLLCTTQPVKPTMRVVEMVKNVDFFLRYPWGRESFVHTLAMVTVGARIKDHRVLISKLKQHSLVVHGFPLAIQLYVLRSVPMLRRFLKGQGEGPLLKDLTVTRLHTLKSFHSSSILSVEYAPSLVVMLPQLSSSSERRCLSGNLPMERLEACVRNGFVFSPALWHGGDNSLPPLEIPCKEESSCGGTDGEESEREPSVKRRKACSSEQDGDSCSSIDLRLEARLDLFRRTILDDVRKLLKGEIGGEHVEDEKDDMFSAKPDFVVREPVRVTRSGSAGLYASAKHISSFSPDVHPLSSRTSTSAQSHRPGGCVFSPSGAEVPRTEAGATGGISCRLPVSKPSGFATLASGHVVRTGSSSAGGYDSTECIKRTVPPSSSTGSPACVSPCSAGRTRFHPGGHRSNGAGVSIVRSGDADIQSLRLPDPLVPTSLVPKSGVVRNSLPTRRVNFVFRARATEVSSSNCVLTDSARLSAPTSELFKRSCFLMQRSVEPLKPDSIKCFLSRVDLFKKRITAVDGHPCAPEFFDALFTPQHWVTSLHIDLLVSASWMNYGASLSMRRITFLNSLFSTIIIDPHLRTRASSVSGCGTWHPLLSGCVEGNVSGREETLRWFRDVDHVFVPMNWGKRYWVALDIDLLKFHITILDPLRRLTSDRRIRRFMDPFVKPLWELIVATADFDVTSVGQDGFTYSRCLEVSQNIRTGDCGPLCVKFMELRSHDHPLIGSLSDEMVDNLRMCYAMDVFRKFAAMDDV